MKQDNSNINSRIEVRTVKVTRWRSIEQSLDEIKKLDPETAITVFLIRKLCKNKHIHTQMAGTKYLVDLDNLFEYLGFITEMVQA